MPPPAMTPFHLGDLTIANRVVVAPPFSDTSAAGAPGDDVGAALSGAAATGAGLVVTDPVAVSGHGRITSGSVGCWTEQHGEAWGRIVDEVHARGAKVAMRLTHSGRRGSCRPRDRGVDRPLREGAWTTIAASEIAYAPWMPVPAAVDEQRFREVPEDFATAAGLAAAAGVDVLLVDCSDGYLLSSFLSPLSNHRDDEYGGDVAGRLRFPLEVIHAVRSAWPHERPTGVRLTVDDRHRRGLQVDEGCQIARAMAEAGIDLALVTGGLTIGTDAAAGDYRRLYQVSLADRVRNEAGLATIATGRITTIDEVNTIVAAGRGDLCVLDPYRYRRAGDQGAAA